MKQLRLPLLAALVLVLAGVAARWWYVWQRERSQDAPILAAARRYGVEPALVKAVVWRESWFDPHARGHAGELGLMQLREPAAREWAEAEHLAGFNHEQVLDPATNTFAGAWYLAKALKRYTNTDNALPYALADYNAGRGNVLKWLHGAGATNSAVFSEQIGFPMTRRYVQSVMKRRERYQPVFPETKVD